MKKRPTLRALLLTSYLLVIALATLGSTLVVSPALWRYFVREREIEMLTQGSILAQAVRREIYQGAWELPALLRLANLQLSSRVLILDATGLVLGAIEGRSEGTVVEIDRAALKSALGGRSMATIRQSGREQTLDVLVPVTYPGVADIAQGEVLGVVLISRSLLDLHERQRSIVARLIKGNIFIALLVVPMAIFYAGRISSPLTKLTAKAERMTAGALGMMVEPAGDREVFALGEAFNSLSQRLVLLEEARRKFVADASHELRTPLASLKALLAPLVREEPASPEIVREFLSDMDRELDRLSQLVEDLLKLARLDSKQDLEQRATDLSVLVVKIVKALAFLAEERGVRVEVETLPAAVIWADENRLHGALLNIVDNAIKYAHSVVRVSMVKGEQVEIRVEDDGPGIPEAARKRLFERFYRLDQARARHNGGSGLGLAIAWEIINRHRGSIQVISEVGKGTLVVVELPLRQIVFQAIDESKGETAQNAEEGRHEEGVPVAHHLQQGHTGHGSEDCARRDGGIVVTDVGGLALFGGHVEEGIKQREHDAGEDNAGEDAEKSDSVKTAGESKD
ncbi:MAG: Sensor histidine kinase CpxA [Firmicutes bacterium]|nr:Sensor histidine kinase CpxA [Bacillota bacterium]